MNEARTPTQNANYTEKKACEILSDYNHNPLSTHQPKKNNKNLKDFDKLGVSNLVQ